jgi:6-phosphogluconate dehydrogenase
MKNKPPPPAAEIGMVGLGVMGRNLVLNVADHGCPVAGYDKDPAKIEALRQCPKRVWSAALAGKIR